MPKLHDLGVAEAAKAIRTGETTAEALADALLARAAAHKSLNAFIALEPDKVRAAAREADRKRAAGASAGPCEGPVTPFSSVFRASAKGCAPNGIISPVMACLPSGVMYSFRACWP